MGLMGTFVLYGGDESENVKGEELSICLFPIFFSAFIWKHSPLLMTEDRILEKKGE